MSYVAVKNYLHAPMDEVTRYKGWPFDEYSALEVVLGDKRKVRLSEARTPPFISQGSSSHLHHAPPSFRSRHERLIMDSTNCRVCTLAGLLSHDLAYQR